MDIENLQNAEWQSKDWRQSSNIDSISRICIFSFFFFFSRTHSDFQSNYFTKTRNAWATKKSNPKNNKHAYGNGNNLDIHFQVWQKVTKSWFLKKEYNK